MGTYFTSIKGFSKKIKIDVSEVGKISLKGKYIKIDKCRDWLIELLIELMKIQDEFLLTKDFSLYIRSHDYIKRTKLYNYIRSKNAQEKLLELIEKVIILKNNTKIECVEFLFPSDIAYYFQDFLINSVNSRCQKSDSNAILQCPNEDCNSTNFIKNKKSGKDKLIKCIQCKTEISEEIEIECINNHKQYLNKNEIFAYIFSLELKTEINKIFKILEIGFLINNDKEIYYIKENKLYRTINEKKLLYQWNELPSFKKIPKINELHLTIQKAQTQNITQILEKCKEYKGKCRNCHLLKNSEIDCISKIFSKLSNGQSHPHSGLEFGDFEFSQKFSTGLELIYGIAKSYKKTSNDNLEYIHDIPFSKLTFKNNDNLLEQFIEACFNESISFVLIVSGRVVDTQLKMALIEITKWKSKKLVIITPKDLIPILAFYFKNYNDFNQ